jgi:hypothetical protein
MPVRTATAIDEDLLMDLGDVGHPEKLADLIITRRADDAGPPVDVETLAMALGVREITHVSTDAFEGTLITNPAKGVAAIALRKASPRERQRFTIAHELGHFLIPTHGREAQCGLTDLRTPDRAAEKEKQANLFAASLLMPARMIQRDMRTWSEPTLEEMIALAARYEVSKEAMARRVVELTDHASAVIFSKDRRLRAFMRSAAFPSLDVKIGQLLPDGSATARTAWEAAAFRDWEEVCPEVWLTGGSRRRGDLFEQIIDLAAGHRMTLLSFEDER